MNYLRVYEQFIADRQANPLPEDAYGEDHHIVPRSIWSDGNDYTIRLSAEDHFFAHLLLGRVFGGTQWLPVKWFMRFPEYRGEVGQRRRASIRLAREKGREAISKAMVGVHLGAVRSEETRSKMRESQCARHGLTVEQANIRNEQRERRSADIRLMYELARQLRESGVLDTGGRVKGGKSGKARNRKPLSDKVRALRAARRAYVKTRKEKGVAKHPVTGRLI